MRPLLEIWLASEVMVLVAAIVSLFVPQPARRRPVWLGFIILMVLIAGGALSAADRHDGQVGADILTYGAVFLYGFALALGLVTLRDYLARRGASDA